MTDPPRPEPTPPAEVTESISLLRRAQQDDRSALDRLFARYYERVRVVARLRMGERLKSYEDPDDIVQKAFVAAIGALPNFTPRSEGSLLRWFTTIVERQISDAVDYHLAEKRDRRREQEFGDRRPDTEGSVSVDFSASDTLPPDRAGRRAELSALVESFQRLSKAHQSVWCARFLDPTGSWDEIAEASGCPNGKAARSLWNRATAKLAAAMARLESEGDRSR